MKTENVVLMKQAREALVGKWGMVAGTTFVFCLISIAVQNIPKAGGILSLIIEGPLFLGYTIFILAIVRNQPAKLDQLFLGFNRFGTALVAYLLMGLFTLLWALLLIVPGIIAAISYTMTPFILADHPNMEAREAIKRSKKMMDGYKLKMFYLHLRFLGWAILCVLTLGIGFLWLIPYIEVSVGKFYEEIKNGEVPTVA